jgi:hypothetical protein
VPAGLHDAIVAAYHEHCIDLPRVKDWNDKRRKALNARILERLKAGKPADQLSYWESFFREKVAPSDHLNGRGKSDWRASLEWLVQKTNFLKVIEDHYENRGSNAR